VLESIRHFGTVGRRSPAEVALSEAPGKVDTLAARRLQLSSVVRARALCQDDRSACCTGALMKGHGAALSPDTKSSLPMSDTTFTQRRGAQVRARTEQQTIWER
jgi:hypothetical protein